MLGVGSYVPTDVREDLVMPAPVCLYCLYVAGDIMSNRHLVLHL